MPSRKVLHHDNKVICDEHTCFRHEVERYIDLIRPLLENLGVGQVDFFYSMEKVHHDRTANFRELDLVTETLLKQEIFQIKTVYDQRMLMHMALSEISD